MILHFLTDSTAAMEQWILIVVITANAIAFLATILRCVSRFYLVRQVGADDILSIVALLASIAMTVMIERGTHHWRDCLSFANSCVEGKHGLGLDISQVSGDDLFQFRKVLWIMVIAYNIGMSSCKTSAVLQFLRFIRLGHMRTLCWGLFAFLTAFGLAALLAGIFSCMPIAYSWDKSIPGGHCRSHELLWLLAAGVVIIADIICVMIPIVTFKDLRLPRRQKFALIFVFMLGAL